MRREGGAYGAGLPGGGGWYGGTDGSRFGGGDGSRAPDMPVSRRRHSPPPDHPPPTTTPDMPVSRRDVPAEAGM